MKIRISILLLFFLTTSARSQITIPDSVKFQMNDVHKIVNKIKKLQIENRIKMSIIDELEFQVRQDSIILSNRKLQISSLNEELKLWRKRSKRSFFNSETWGFIKGVVLVVAASWVVNNVK